MTRKFRWVDPQSGDEIIATMTTERDHNARACRRDLKGRLVNTFTFILEVTQWGFTGERSIVVARCNEDGKTWAFQINTMYEDEEAH